MMQIIGMRGAYPDVDGCTVSMGRDSVILTTSRSHGEMLDPHDARELAAQLTRAANHLIAMTLRATVAAASGEPAQAKEE